MERERLLHRMHHIFQQEEEMDDSMKKEAAILIQNIFRYMEKDAKDIMTHRKQIVAIDGDMLLEEALDFMLGEQYSRFPVYKEDIDEIVGTLHLREAITGYMNEDLRKTPVRDLGDYVHPVKFIPETKSIDTLFKEMQTEKKHMAIVLDEYGQTSGLVALEDILEELVGNIMDEYDEEEVLITKQADGTYLADGFIDLEDLEEYIDLVFEKEEYETLNGFLIAQLDRIPSMDEKEDCIVEYEGYRFTILSVDNKTIKRVKIEKIKE